MIKGNHFFVQPRVTLLRPGFREQDEWRSTLRRESLRVFSNFTGNLDAKEAMPAGSMLSRPDGHAQPSIAFRED